MPVNSTTTDVVERDRPEKVAFHPASKSRPGLISTAFLLAGPALVLRLLRSRPHPKPSSTDCLGAPRLYIPVSTMPFDAGCDRFPVYLGGESRSFDHLDAPAHDTSSKLEPYFVQPPTRIHNSKPQIFLPLADRSFQPLGTS